MTTSLILLQIPTGRYFFGMMYEKSFTTIADILNAARNLFVSNSYDDITMRQIAQEANVTKGAIYHHFKGKEELFLRMMVDYLEKLQELLHQAIIMPGTARERLFRLTELYLEKPLTDQRTIQLVRRDNSRFQGNTRDELITAYQNALPNQIEMIITDGINANEIKSGDPRIYAWQFVAIVEVSLSSYARQRIDSPQKMANYLTDVFFDGVAV